jgi:predicted PurR-regulated permease PerM
MKPQIARVLAVIAILAACLHLLSHLLAPVCWSALLAVSTWPLRQRLLQRIGPQRRRLAAGLLTGAVVLLLLVPLGFLVYRGLLEVPSLLQLWGTSQTTGLAPPSWLGGLPLIGAWALKQWGLYLEQPGALSGVLHGFAHGMTIQSGRALFVMLSHRAISFVFCAVVLFFLYADGDALARQVEAVLLRQFGHSGVHTMQLAVQTVRGTVNGLVLVGLAVALVMSLAYAVAGVLHPAVWGLATGLLGILPLGATVVLAGVALYLLTVGSTVAAIVLLAVGSVFIFIVDHFVRPAFIAGSSRLPLVLALLGIVGGLETFGLLGIFVGPTLLAVMTAVWRELAMVSEPGSSASAPE